MPLITLSNLIVSNKGIVHDLGCCEDLKELSKADCTVIINETNSQPGCKVANERTVTGSIDHKANSDQNQKIVSGTNSENMMCPNLFVTSKKYDGNRGESSRIEYSTNPYKECQDLTSFSTLTPDGVDKARTKDSNK